MVILFDQVKLNLHGDFNFHGSIWCIIATALWIAFIQIYKHHKDLKLKETDHKVLEASAFIAAILTSIASIQWLLKFI